MQSMFLRTSFKYNKCQITTKLVIVFLLWNFFSYICRFITFDITVLKWLLNQEYLTIQVIYLVKNYNFSGKTVIFCNIYFPGDKFQCFSWECNWQCKSVLQRVFDRWANANCIWDIFLNIPTQLSFWLIIVNEQNKISMLVY